MIVVIAKRATAEQISHMVRARGRLGTQSSRDSWHGAHGHRSDGAKRSDTKEALESGSGVAEVMPIWHRIKVATGK